MSSFSFEDKKCWCGQPAKVRHCSLHGEYPPYFECAEHGFRSVEKPKLPEEQRAASPPSPLSFWNRLSQYIAAKVVDFIKQ